MASREIYLAGGCFWGAEKYLGLIPGVLTTQVGYANGRTNNPSYEDVCAGSGHAETVHVAYDDAQLPLSELLELYFDAIDPSSVNRQGNDVGEQYRTGIYYTDAADAPVVAEAIERMERRLRVKSAVEVAPLGNFWPAEDYHQGYLVKNPQGYCHIPAALFREAASYRGVGRVPKYPVPSQAELRRRLSPEQYHVTQEMGTEQAFSGQYWDAFEPGIYVDVTTGEPLFSSEDKFPSACGWPAFSKPIAPEVLVEHMDTSHGMVRTEVASRSGNAHVGHVFGDGPAELGGKRYCIDSAALRFVPAANLESEGYGYLDD